MTDSSGFWSYVRSDDENSGGRVRKLADHIRREYTLITGEELRLFIDRDLEWGQHWKRRIEDELQSVTFLIPVVTPAFFKSEDCREELLTFAGHAESLGMDELVLPIYYVEVAALEDHEEGEDKVVDLVHKRQREDWRELRLASEDDPDYRSAVNKAARRLEEIASKTQSPRESIEVVGTEKDEVDDDLGFIDLLAEGEAAIPTWTNTLQELTDQMQLMRAAAEAGSADFETSDARGRGFAGKLAVARKLAGTFDPIAERMSQLGSDYAGDLVRVDPMVLTLIRMAKDGTTEGDETPLEFFAAVLQMVTVSRQASEQLRFLIGAMEVPAKASRDLRVPLNKIKAALRKVLDGQAVMDEWERQIQSLRLDLPSVELAEEEATPQAEK